MTLQIASPGRTRGRVARSGTSLRPAAATTALILSLLVLLVGCDGGTATDSLAPSAESKVDGLVIDIVTTGPVDVASFTVRTAGGELVEFTVGTLDVSGDGFPAEHLGEHRIAAEPVAVFYRDEDGKHVAYRLEDAEATPAAS